MSELVEIARFMLHAGKAEEFKRLSTRCMQIVRAEDTGTLGYEIYLDDDETSAVVIERYTGPEALTEHLEHIGDELMAAILATGTVEGETMGEVPAEMRAQMAGTSVRVLAPFLSL